MKALDEFLLRSALVEAGEVCRYVPLAGGVSSDIWQVEIGPTGGTSVRHLPIRSLCVKRALPRLKVAADWQAPVSRNAYEWAWLCFAAGVLPAAVPQPLAHDAAAGLFAMSYLPPDEHPVWKQQLLAGQVDASTARAVGRILGTLHGASAGRADLARAFDSGTNFLALRLEPYLLASAECHPPLAARLRELAARTAGIHTALVHGDVSPKNILVGPRGPVLLDAECAWYGDPAFDLAFCLNHLLLKVLPRPEAAAALARSFAALVQAYFEALGPAPFEPRAAIEARAAELLPALLLARIDGKSPVEYVSEDAQRERVRAVAGPLILAPVRTLAEVAARWYGA